VRQLVTLSLVALGFASAVLAQPAPKKRALLVGVSTYQKAGLADKPLPFAAPDMEELAITLKDAGWDVRLLVSKGSLNQATRCAVVKAFDETLDGVNAQDAILIAFSGHGQQFRAGIKNDDDQLVEAEEAFFCPSDAVRNEIATLLGLSEILRQLGKRGGCNMVMVDACRDDPRRGGGKGIDGNTVRNLPANTAVLLSCAARQQSFETNQMNPATPEKGHGVFLHRVLQGLKKDARNARGEVTWDRLAEYVKESVNDDALRWFPERAILNAAGEKVVQTPHAVGSLIGRSPVLVGQPDPDDVFEPDLPGVVTAPWFLAGGRLVRMAHHGFGLRGSGDGSDETIPRSVPGFQCREWAAIDFKDLPSPPSAFALQLIRGKATPETFEILARLAHLRSVSFSKTAGMPAPGLGELSRLANLRHLEFDVCEDADLKTVARLVYLKSLAINDTNVSDAGLRELAPIQSLRSLSLCECRRITGVGFKSWDSCPLQFLNLGRSGVNNAGLEDVATIGGLQELWLAGSNVTDAGIAKLARLKRLRRLEMTECKTVTGEGFAVFNDLGDVRRLDLDKSGVTDAGLKAMAGMTWLNELRLRETAITDAGLAELGKLPNLRRLTLNRTSVTDKGIAALARLPDLEYLMLDGCRGITDASLTSLTACKHLTKLAVEHTGVTKAGVKEFERRMPRVSVNHR